MSRIPYEWCSEMPCLVPEIRAMQPIDLIVVGALAVMGYSIFWVVRHERAVRRFRSASRS
jgi:hypothetical protein